MLLYQPALAADIGSLPFERTADLPGVALLVELFDLLQRQPGLNTGAILEHWRGREEARHLNKLARWTPLRANLDLAAELHGHLHQISRQLDEMRIRQLLDGQRRTTLNEYEKQELKELLQKNRAPGPI